MDHARYINTVQQVSRIARQYHDAKNGLAQSWKFNCTPVIKPQARCSFCRAVITSPAIWFLKGFRNQILAGIYRVDGPRFSRMPLEFPHLLDSRGTLCLGGFNDGTQLLASPVNLNDCPMGKHKVPIWYRNYWDHPICQGARDWLRDNAGLTESRHQPGLFIIRDALGREIDSSSGQILYLSDGQAADPDDQESEDDGGI